MPEGTSWVEATSNSEKNQARSFNHCQVMLVWEAVSQKIPSNKSFLKFCIYFVDLHPYYESLLWFMLKFQHKDTVELVLAVPPV